MLYFLLINEYNYTYNHELYIPNCTINTNLLIYKDYINYIAKLADNNSMEEVIHKIDVCIDTKEFRFHLP